LEDLLDEEGGEGNDSHDLDDRKVADRQQVVGSKIEKNGE
jgi:hypothetical protein